MIGVCKRGWIQEIKRNIKPSAAMAYKTRGNGKSEPSNEANIPVNAPAPIIYVNAGKLT